MKITKTMQFKTKPKTRNKIVSKKSIITLHRIKKQ